MEFSEAVQAALAPAREAQKPGLAIKPLCNAILQNEASVSTLTSAHLLLVRYSLQSHMYAEALPVIDRQIFYFQNESKQPKTKLVSSLAASGSGPSIQDLGLTQKLRYQDVLEYFLGAGTIYIGLRQWEKALDALENVITYPVKDNQVSKLMTDAYKKWVLVKVLLEGRAGGLPHITNQNAAKIYHIIAKPYETVASMFRSVTATRLRQEVMAGDQIWQDDGNTGLMLLVLASYQKFQIRGLADVYHTLSISEVTRKTASAEPGEKIPSDEATEALLVDMIAAGDLNGSVSHPANSPAMLTFISGALILSELEVKTQIAASLERAKSISIHVKATDKRLTHDKEYLKWAKGQKKMSKAMAEGGMAGEEMMWNGAEDEDLMESNF